MVYGSLKEEILETLPGLLFFMYVNTLSLSKDKPGKGIRPHCRWL